MARDVARFGGFRLALSWLHSFEEPFLNVEELEALGKRADLRAEETSFVGALCCLALRESGDTAMSADTDGPSTL